MLSFRQWVRIAAAFIIGCGLLCFPSPGGSPKRFTSLFTMSADSGAFFHLGLPLVGGGLVLLLITFLGRRE